MEQNKIKFKDFPEKLKQRVLEIRKQQYGSHVKHMERDLSRHSLVNLFTFIRTKEGVVYWSNVYSNNDFSDFEDSKIIKKDKVIKLSDQTLKINTVEDKMVLFIWLEILFVFLKNHVVLIIKYLKY